MQLRQFIQIKVHVEVDKVQSQKVEREKLVLWTDEKSKSEKAEAHEVIWEIIVIGFLMADL